MERFKVSRANITHRTLLLAALLLPVTSLAEVIVNDGFEDENADGWTLNGNIVVNGIQAIGDFSLRHKKSGTSVLQVPTTGFTDVSITMNLAATSLEKNDDCYAEVSTNGGSSWSTVVEVHNGNDNGTFFSNTVTPAGADDNADLQLRFRATGRHNGDYCWGDEVTVSGTPGVIETEPDISLSGNGAFGEVEINTTANRNLTLSNNGDDDLLVGSLGGIAAPFSLTADACSSATISPGGDCQVTVRFAPTNTGLQSDTLNIPSNDPDTPVLTVALSGTGNEPPGEPEPNIALSGNPAFGNVEINATSDHNLTISNTGSAPLLVGSVGGITPPFSLIADACSSTSVSPGGDCQLTVRFAPTVAGPDSDLLDISSNDPDTPVLGVVLNGTGTEPGGGFDPNFDPLSGNGNTDRNLLTYNTLINGSDPGSRINLSAYAVPANAAQPDHQFEGSLQLSGEASGGDFKERKDTFRYTRKNRDTTRKHLPEFDFEFIQTGTHLFPVARGTMTDNHPEWEYILEAGRVWKENGDNGYSRASIPFTLHQKNADCMHNGVLSFLFMDDGTTSQAAYQIASETCLYFKFDMWGLLGASYSPTSVTNADDQRANYQLEVNNRMPSKPISELANDHPGADPSQFGSASETDPDHVTLFGFTIDGVHYTGGCDTRYGAYPYCDAIALPSYSTAKSVFAGLALMRMELNYPGFMGNNVASQVNDCAANGNWGDVNYGHVIDMGTGNYNLGGYMSDEGSLHTNDLFLPLDHASKIDYSCTQYDRKATPGSKWIYHTSDTYILGTAMNQDLKDLEGGSKDLFDDLLVDDILKPVGTSPTSHYSRRTYDSVQQPFTGWGMTYLRDDVAKIAVFLNVDDGKVDGNLLVDGYELDAALQRVPSDRGLDPLADFKYNNGFWAHEIQSNISCSSDVWVPFMSGYGGITVLLLPNDTAYYMFSDDATFVWMKAAQESHRIRSLCP